MTDKEKLQLAIETLEYFIKYSNDSRNFGMIDVKVKETLNKIK